MAGGAEVSVPRRGFVVFPRGDYQFRIFVNYQTFQSPEGDSLFFYNGTRLVEEGVADGEGDVSVPRRGFIVFLPEMETQPVNVAVYEFQSPEGDSLFFYAGDERRGQPLPHAVVVSVPRRGFIVFLRKETECRSKGK